MFPLGQVLFPGMALPLRIFEPRYQRLLADVLDGDGAFGIVLIERGWEVGGGDSRFDVGTVVHVEAHEAIANDRHEILVLAMQRIRVTRWLDDDPYPRAEVALWPDVDDADPAATTRRYEACTAQLRRFLALAAEMGHRVPAATFEVPTDPSIGSHRLCALSPVGVLDRQQLLECPGPAERLERLSRAIDEQLALLTPG